MRLFLPHNAMRIATIAAILLPLTATAQVEVNIKLMQDQSLSVVYKLPPNCPQLRFGKDGAGAAKIRAKWQAQGQGLANKVCFTVEGDYLKSKDANCQQAHFTVPASTDKITGYPAAFPMGETVYLHTSNYQVDDHCGAMSYQIEAPHIALEGQQKPERIVVTPKSDYSFPVLLSPHAFSHNNGIISYIDPLLSTDTIARINEVGEKTISFLKGELPRAHFAMPIIVAANVKHPGSTGYDGDAGNVLRLSLFNWPNQLDPSNKTAVTSFVAHEFSHRFQQRDAVDIYPQSRVIHEGGGEFLRWTTSVSLGWLSHQEAAADLDNALGKCFLGTDQSPWSALSPEQIGQRQLEYRCGLAAYVYGIAARQNAQAGIRNFGDFYANIQQGNKPDFYDAIECGNKTDCHPLWLPQLFNGKAPMQTVWRNFLKATGMAKEIPANQMQTDLMIKKAFSKLMIDDCGESSYFEARDGLIMDDINTCKTLKKEMKVIGVEAYPLFGNPHALPAFTQACKARGKVRLRIAGAQDLEVACKTVYQPISSFYAVDIEKVLQRLRFSDSR
ncbi:MAG: hypothetical protein Q8Q55_00205 [Undibacterium sp.]|nr:hypothetical protein [Undibacterium sp.]